MIFYWFLKCKFFFPQMVLIVVLNVFSMFFPQMVLIVVLNVFSMFFPQMVLIVVLNVFSMFFPQMFLIVVLNVFSMFFPQMVLIVVLNGFKAVVKQSDSCLGMRGCQPIELFEGLNWDLLEDISLRIFTFCGSFWANPGTSRQKKVLLDEVCSHVDLKTFLKT